MQTPYFSSPEMWIVGKQIPRNLPSSLRDEVISFLVLTGNIPYSITKNEHYAFGLRRNSNYLSPKNIGSSDPVQER